MKKQRHIQDRIVEVIKAASRSPLSAQDIAAALELRGKNRKQLQKYLTELVRMGHIVVVRGNRYGIGQATDLVTGRLDFIRSGGAFLIDERGGADVFIPRRNTGIALPGDRAVVRLEREWMGTGERRSGRVIRVIKRARQRIAGTLRQRGRFLYVTPIDSRYAHDFCVPAHPDASLEDRVVVEMRGWETRHASPEGEIVEVLGPASDATIDTQAIMAHYGYDADFPAPVRRQAADAARRLSDVEGRLDWRDELVLTIDPVTARDFDDALSMGRDDKGRRVLGVHIADVSHFVPPDSALDREARQRGNSVYFPGHVVPMLPEELSNGVCSLQPDRDRLAFSAFLTVDDQGRITGAEFARTIIRSRCRLTYEQALGVIEGDAQAAPEASSDVPEDCRRLLGQLHKLAQQLRSRRMARHALELDVPEYEVVIDDTGNVSDIQARESDVSHQLVEECMIAANEGVDRSLSEAGYEIVHRVHEAPSEEKIDGLTESLRGMGYQPGDLHVRANMVAFLRSLRGDPIRHRLQIEVLRSMKKAVYSVRPDGHYGLAKKYYAHFTSPIRRYPDLVVHRILAEALEGRRNPYEHSVLRSAATWCSQTEQSAAEAERALIEIKKYRYLEQELASKRPLAHAAL